MSQVSGDFLKRWLILASDENVNTATRINSIRMAIALLHLYESKLLELEKKEQEVVR